MNMQMIVLPLTLAALVLLVLYYVRLVRTILEMLERGVDRVLLTEKLAEYQERTR